MIVTIKERELYPFLWIDEQDKGEWSVEVPNEIIDRWRQVMEDFWTVQEEMERFSTESGRS